MRAVDLAISDNRLELPESSLVQCLVEIDQCPGISIPEGSIDVAFVDEETCSRLHKDFFGNPEITDVMTFPGDPADRHAGDIAICPLVAWTTSREHELSFDEELTLYLVHACLHLAGLDDRNKEDSREMRAAEERVMDLLRRTGSLLKPIWSA